MPALPIRVTIVAALSLAPAACRDEPFTATRPGADAIHVQPAALTLAVGQEARLEAVVVDRAGRAVPGAELFFRSDRPHVTEVSPAGNVKALSTGTATVTAYHGRLRTLVQVQVTVPDASGELVAFSLLVGNASRILAVDTWSLSHVYLPFTATGRNGESLCGRVPLSFRSDSLVARAEPPPALGDPCRIRIVPRDAGKTRLVVRAGAFADSVEVVVTRTRYRAILEELDLGAGQPRTVGDTVHYRFTGIDEHGNGVRGLSLRFTAPGVLSATTATTDSLGQATVEWRLPTKLPDPLLAEHTVLRVFSAWPDGGIFLEQAFVALKPDRPVALVFMVERLVAARSIFCGWEVADGDTVRLSGPAFFLFVSCPPNRLRISLIDQYGNLAGGDADTEVTTDHPAAITGRSVLASGFPVVVYSFTATAESPWARGLRLTARAPNAPAVPPRTVVVVPYCNGCP